MEVRGRHSIRLKGYDYSTAGGYFVTMVAFGRESLFGEIENDEMQINALGDIVREEWFRSAQIRKEIRLEENEFVIMPNHIHGIVWIKSVGADGVRPTDGVHTAGFRQSRGANLAPLQRPSKSLSSFIAGFKASVTSRAGRELNSANIWQRNYYEHIIRNPQDYERIAGYIVGNPPNWSEDGENVRPNPAFIKIDWGAYTNPQNSSLQPAPLSALRHLLQ